MGPSKKLSGSGRPPCAAGAEFLGTDARPAHRGLDHLVESAGPDLQRPLDLAHGLRIAIVLDDPEAGDQGHVAVPCAVRYQFHGDSPGRSVRGVSGSCARHRPARPEDRRRSSLRRRSWNALKAPGKTAAHVSKAMSRPLASDALPEALAPPLPGQRPRPRGGRPRCGNRSALADVILVLRPGPPRKMPRPVGPAAPAWPAGRRLRAWQAAGVRARRHRVLLERLPDTGQPDWSRASPDPAAVAAEKRECQNQPEPGGSRAKPGLRRPLGLERRAAKPGQPARQPDAGPRPRRRAWRAPGPRACAQAPRQAPRR